MFYGIVVPVNMCPSNASDNIHFLIVDIDEPTAKHHVSLVFHIQTTHEIEVFLKACDTREDEVTQPNRFEYRSCRLFEIGVELNHPFPPFMSEPDIRDVVPTLMGASRPHKGKVGHNQRVDAHKDVAQGYSAIAFLVAQLFEVIKEPLVEFHQPHPEIRCLPIREPVARVVLVLLVYVKLSCVFIREVEIQSCERVIVETRQELPRGVRLGRDNRHPDIPNRQFIFSVPKRKDSGTMRFHDVGTMNRIPFVYGKPFLPVDHIFSAGYGHGRLRERRRNVVIPTVPLNIYRVFFVHTSRHEFSQHPPLEIININDFE